MSGHPLPELPTLAGLKNRARELRRENGEPLHIAQRAIAREYGFASWPRLRQHVVAIEARTWAWSEPGADEASTDRFLRLACISWDEHAGDPVAARSLLTDHPDLAADIAVAAAAADDAAVGRALAAGADAVGPTGPYGWPPLMYLAYSRLDAGETATTNTARLLLGAGADPNEGRYFLGYPTPFTELTGAFGDGETGQPPHPHALALARVLLESGADPNDGQTLYNRMFATEDDFLHLLFEFGLGSGDGGPWRRRLPELSDSPEDMLRGLLAWAVTHGQADRVALLAEHGVDLAAPLPGADRSPLAAALANGHRDVADVLRRFGAPEPELSPADAFAGAVLAGDRDAVAAADPDVVAAVRAERPGLIVWAAAQGRVAAVQSLADAGFGLDVLARGDVPSEQPWQTALHSAIQHDHVDVVRLLLRLGARTDIRDARFDATPRDWAEHFERPHLVALLDAAGR